VDFLAYLPVFVIPSQALKCGYTFVVTGKTTAHTKCRSDPSGTQTWYHSYSSPSSYRLMHPLLTQDNLTKHTLQFCTDFFLFQVCRGLFQDAASGPIKSHKKSSVDTANDNFDDEVGLIPIPIVLSSSGKKDKSDKFFPPHLILRIDSRRQTRVLSFGR
jgi:hypothetical protein